MSDHAVTISVPGHLYDRARQIAEETARPVEEVIISRLEGALSELPRLPVDEQAELDALVRLSDEALWTIAREQMQPERQARLTALMDGSDKGSLSPEASQKLEELVTLGHRLMLRKAQAASLLIERGYTVSPVDLSADE